MKKTTLWLFALFTCWQMSAQVGIVQNFDSGTTLPTGWTETGGKTIAAAESCSGNSIRDNVYTAAGGTLVTPNQVAASNATDLTVSFDYKIEVWNSTAANPAGWGNIQVQYSTNNGGAWITFFTINDGNHVVANTCANFVNVIPGASLPNGSDVKIRFLYTWVAGDYDIYIDNFSAVQTTILPPVCTTLTSPANGATNVLGSNIVWNSAVGIPTGYKLNVGTISGGTDVLNSFDVGNVTNYNLGTLTAGTTYYVTVIPYNANGDATGCTESSFTTCGAISALPHVEPFVAFLPNCWFEADNGDLTAGPATFGAGSWVVDGLANVGTTEAIRVTLDGATDNDWVISPEFVIPASGYELKFSAAANQSGATTAPTTPWEADDFVEVLITTTGTANWIPLNTFNNSNVPSNTGGISVSDLSAYTGQTVRFAFRAVEGVANGAASIDFSVDNFEVRLAPTCPDQTGLNVTNITSSTVDTSWDPVTTDFEYAITTSITPPASGASTSNTYFLASGLFPQTVYYLHVRTDCGGGTFGNWATTTFTTACGPLASLPWVENFDALATGTNVFPTCWNYSNTLSDWSISTTPVAYSGANSLRRTWSTNGWAFTPTVTLAAGTSYRFSYYVRTNDTTVGYDITVGVGTSQNSAGMTTTLSTVTGYQGPTWTKVTHDFTPSVNGDYSFGVSVVAPFAPNGINFDDFRIELSPTCPDQTGVSFSNVTASGVDTSWDPMSGAVGYEYAITTSATPPASGTPTTALVYIQPSGLSPQTVYYLHVRTECAGSTYGNWATVSFTTLCAPVTTLPHLEPFNTFLPNSCWKNGVNGDLTTGPAAFTASGWGADGLANAGTTGAIRNNIYTTGANDWVISPQFTIPATGYELKFDAAAVQFAGTGAPTTPWEADDFIEVLISTTGTTNWTVLHTYNNTNQPGIVATPLALDLDAYATQTVTFAYRAVEGAANGGADIDFSIDNFEIRLSPATPPACATNLVATPNATCGNFSNSLTWDVEPLATSYYITIGTTSGGTDIANAASIATNSYSFSGSTATTYFWTVTPYNGAGSATGCVEQSFSTVATGCYCASVPTSNDNSGITSATVGLTTNPIADVTYVDLTAVAEVVEPGANTNVQLTFSTGYDYDINIWIDFNNDFDFNDAGELVKTGIACTAVQPNTVDASFIMPLTAPTGLHRMRIGTADDGQVPPAPCYSDAYGVTLDFTVDTTLSSNSFDTTNFVAYPNPVKDVLNLSYKTAINNVRVVNLLGQEVLNAKTNTNDVQVNMSALAAGAYIVNITVEDTVHTIKVIKE